MNKKPFSFRSTLHFVQQQNHSNFSRVSKQLVLTKTTYVIFFKYLRPNYEKKALKTTCTKKTENVKFLNIKKAYKSKEKFL